MLDPTPSECVPAGLRLGDFATITEALDYAAQGPSGFNFYSGRGELVERLPYRDLRDQAQSFARRMLRAGLRKGDRLAVLAETTGDFARIFFACQYAGIIPVPLPLPTSFGGRGVYEARIRRLLEGCGASGLLSSEEFSSLLAPAGRDLSLKILGALDVLGSVPEDGVDLPSARETELCYLQFSSGSTRFPQGVSVTHRALMSNAAGISQWGLQVRPGDRCVSWLPFYHDMGLVGFFLAPLASQLSVDYLATRDFARRPMAWLNILSRNGGTISYSPSFGYDLCGRWAATTPPNGIDLSRWRIAGIGGDMVRPQILERFADAFASVGFDAKAFVASYGMAETTLAVSFAPLGSGIEVDCIDLNRLEKENVAIPVAGTDGAHERGMPRTRSFVVCGRVLPDMELEVRADDGTSLGDRGVGTIWVRGPSVMEGYYGRPEETAQALSADGWLNTGDVGYKLDGAIVIVGRRKDLIIVNGRNIAPQDLEWSAEQVSGVRPGDVAAFSIDDDAKGTERVVLLVQCRLQESNARADLATQVGDAIRNSAGIECEVVLVPHQSLPYTSSGKLSRSQAKQKFLRGEHLVPNSRGGQGPEPRAAAGPR